jgi:hypothetical protein
MVGMLQRESIRPKRPCLSGRLLRLASASSSCSDVDSQSNDCPPVGWHMLQSPARVTWDDGWWRPPTSMMIMNVTSEIFLKYYKFRKNVSF